MVTTYFLRQHQPAHSSVTTSGEITHQVLWPVVENVAARCRNRRSAADRPQARHSP